MIRGQMNSLKKQAYDIQVQHQKGLYEDFLGINQLMNPLFQEAKALTSFELGLSGWSGPTMGEQLNRHISDRPLVSDSVFVNSPEQFYQGGQYYAGPSVLNMFGGGTAPDPHRDNNLLISDDQYILLRNRDVRSEAQLINELVPRAAGAGEKSAQEELRSYVDKERELAKQAEENILRAEKERLLAEKNANMRENGEGFAAGELLAVDSVFVPAGADGGEVPSEDGVAPGDADGDAGASADLASIKKKRLQEKLAEGEKTDNAGSQKGGDPRADATAAAESIPHLDLDEQAAVEDASAEPGASNAPGDAAAEPGVSNAPREEAAEPGASNAPGDAAAEPSATDAPAGGDDVAPIVTDPDAPGSDDQAPGSMDSVPTEKDRTMLLDAELEP